VTVRIAIHVQPGARRASVGGRYGEALVVRVTAPAADQRATRAALEAVAAAFGLRPAGVRLATGARSRSKLVDVDVDPVDGAAILERLLARE